MGTISYLRDLSLLPVSYEVSRFPHIPTAMIFCFDSGQESLDQTVDLQSHVPEQICLHSLIVLLRCFIKVATNMTGMARCSRPINVNSQIMVIAEDVACEQITYLACTKPLVQTAVLET